MGKLKEVSKREAQLQLREKQAAFDKGTQSPNRPDRMTLRQFIDQYPDRRRQGGDGKGYLREAPKLSEKTITHHLMTLRYLVKHFGNDKAINSITLADASGWVDALAGGEVSRGSEEVQPAMGIQSASHRNMRTIWFPFRTSCRVTRIIAAPHFQKAPAAAQTLSQESARGPMPSLGCRQGVIGSDAVTVSQQSPLSRGFPVIRAPQPSLVQKLTPDQLVKLAPGVTV